MTKVLLISDSHFENDILEEVINYHQDIDLYIHCGDSSLPYHHALLNNFITVKGNHDEDDRFLTDRFTNINGIRTFITHGHLYHVYKSDEMLIEKAKKLKCTLILHGHTHIPEFKKIGPYTIINPGSLMFNRGNYGYGTYAIMTISDDLDIHCHFYHHITHEIVDEVVLSDGKEMLQMLRNRN